MTIPRTAAVRAAGFPRGADTRPMTPVVLTVALAFVSAVGVVALAAVVTGARLPRPRDLASAVRAGLGRPKETFTLDEDVDDAADRVEDVFVVGRPDEADEVPVAGLAHVLERTATAARRR